MRGGMPRKEARGLEFGMDIRSRKEDEGRAEWRRLPAELSSCIVGTPSKISTGGVTTSAGFDQVPGRTMRQYGREGKY